jgi:3-phosphoshikimate 1-carboxyvinyltransferase
VSTTTATVAPGAPPPRWQVRVPGSKSLTNRALLLAAVAGQGRSRLRNPLLSDDTHVMVEAARALGATVEVSTDADGAAVWSVGGLAGPPTGDASVWCGMAGTVGRFLLPMLAAGEGRFAVDAHPQLRRRPLGLLLKALRAQGAEIEGETFPLSLISHGLAGGDLEVDASVSSQFLSGLLMAAPLARTTTTLRFDTVVSRPYLDLTSATMRAFGVSAGVGDREINVPVSGYVAADYDVEPDASTASYFLASAALTGTTATLPGLDRRETAQGDIELVDFLERMGCEVRDGVSGIELTGPATLRGVDVDMNNSSDVFMTLACVAPFADGPTTIGGIGHARLKESDRIGATAENLRRLGITVEEGEDFLRVLPGVPQTARLPTYDDHRIAMAFSLIGARVPVIIEEPEVVAKTCPTFFELWRETGAAVSLPGDVDDAELATGGNQTGSASGEQW